MQLAREGVPAGVLSIPTRYLHTASEMVDYEDVQGAVALLEAALSDSQVVQWSDPMTTRL